MEDWLALLSDGRFLGAVAAAAIAAVAGLGGLWIGARLRRNEAREADARRAAADRRRARAGWKAEEKRRDRRVLDLQTALRAEILAHVRQLEQVDLSSMQSEVIRRLESDPAYRPFVARERNDTIFQALVADIIILPPSVVEPVSLYYSQIVAIAETNEDLRSAAVGDLPVDRRTALFGDYFAMKIEALRMGRVAVDALTTAIDGARAASVDGVGSGAPLDRGLGK